MEIEPGRPRNGSECFQILCCLWKLPPKSTLDLGTKFSTQLLGILKLSVFLHSPRSKSQLLKYILWNALLQTTRTMFAFGQILHSEVDPYHFCFFE